MLDPQVRLFLDQVAALGRPAPGSLPIDEERALFDQFFARMGGTPVEVGAVRDVEATGPHGAIPVRVYTPVGTTSPRPLFVFYHGGGYVYGSRASYDAVCRLLTRESGCVVASVDYRLAPEFPAPVPFEDGYAALVWLVAHAAELGADGTRVAVGGDSAGGGLAANVTVKAREAGPAIAHQLLIYPFVAYDVESASYRTYSTEYFLTADRMAYYWTCYVPRPEILSQPYVMPNDAASLRGLPSATIVMAECDPLHDQGVAYADRLRSAGVAVELRDYAGMIHAFFSFIGIFDVGRQAVIDAGRAVGTALGAQPATHPSDATIGVPSP